MTTIFGLDFSHYDAVPSGARVVSEGFKFMTHKAGGDAPDAELGSWWKALKPYRDEVFLGAYWVLRRTDGSNAADAFLDRLDSQCAGWRDGPFILQLDCESWNGGTTPAPTKAQIKECADRLRAKMPKLRPIVYAPKWTYGNTLEGLGYPLWASSYVTGSGPASALYPGDNSTRWGAYSGQTPAILQFTSSATALGQTTCDANAYRGTLAELTALLAPGWKQQEEEDMALDKTDAGTLVNTDNVTDGPGLAASVKDGSNPKWSIGQFQRDIANYGRINEQHIADLSAQVAELKGQVVDLSAQLGALEQPVITQDQLTLAVLGALKALAGGQA